MATQHWHKLARASTVVAPRARPASHHRPDERLTARGRGVAPSPLRDAMTEHIADEEALTSIFHQASIAH
eukprot:scaffold31007_cov33-Phaeocystis_antarctica.AAC.1